MLQLAVEHSAAPAAVAVALERLGEARPGLVDRLEVDALFRNALLLVFGASRSLTDLCLSDPAALEVLDDLERRREPPRTGTGETETGRDDATELSRWKRLELLRIAARDLTGLDGLPAVGRALTRMASQVLDSAWRIATAAEGEGGSGQRLAIIGMGKLGGGELNYSSDVDVMFVAADAGAADRIARAVLDAARLCFRVDVDLRPEGRDGPLVRTLESYEAYWDRWAHTWEFQALIKAGPVAGDPELGRLFVERAQDRLWGRAFTSDDLRAVRTMKARAEEIVVRRGVAERELKRGRGGIRDIEFAVQLLQLVHGRHDPTLRSPNTIEALAELGSSGYVDPEDAGDLDQAYRLLRTVEHRLQLVDEQQTHTLPTDEGAQERLARVMGYRDTAEAGARELLLEHLGRQQARVRSIHEHLFFRPLLDALSSPGPGQGRLTVDAREITGSMPAEAVVTRLAAFGFADVERTRQALTELTRGLTRSSRLMQQMLPLLLGWLSDSPDPDLGLLGLRVLTTDEQRATELAVGFRESPEMARRLCLLLGTSARLGEVLEHNPDLMAALGQPGGLAPRSPQALGEGAATAVQWRPRVEERQRGLLRYRRREELRVAAADILEVDPERQEPETRVAQERVAVTAGQLTALAGACLRAALDALAPPLPFAVVAMGRFGGAELSYTSDLDLLFVYDGSTPAEFAQAEKLGEDLMRFLAGPTPALRIYTVDLGLRPEGRDGPVSRSLEGYRAYFERWAQTWERQALLRARYVAGDRDLGGRFVELAQWRVWSEPLTDSERRDIRRMKARIERERIPHGEDPQFHLKLGRGSLSDVEFTAQLLQLQHGVRATGTMEALDELAAAGALDGDDRAALGEAYRFCERTRNRWFLIKGAPGDALPSRPEQLARLSRSLGTAPNDLREQYRRVTRRSRSVVERLFYGKD